MEREHGDAYDEGKPLQWDIGATEVSYRHGLRARSVQSGCRIFSATAAGVSPWNQSQYGFQLWWRILVIPPGQRSVRLSAVLAT